MNAVDPREYLVGLGLAKQGRGRFSAAAKEALAKAKADGVDFLDKAKGTKVGLVPVMTDTGEVKQERRMVNEYAHHAPALRTGILSFVSDDGTLLMVNASEACAACHYSFGWCKCETPTFRYWKSGEVLDLASNER